jgi:surface antigen
VRNTMTMALAFLLTVGALGVMSHAGTEEAAIKKVMKEAMKGGLCKSVAEGKASDDQKKELLELFESLAKAKPPKGEKESWDKKTLALVKAAEAAVDGKSGAPEQLKKASNCKACHEVHKGK